MPNKYQVASIIETVAMKPGGSVEKVYRVQATSVGGTTFSLDIPEAEFTTEEVAKRLNERAALLDSIRAGK